MYVIADVNFFAISRFAWAVWVGILSISSAEIFRLLIVYKTHQEPLSKVLKVGNTHLALTSYFLEEKLLTKLYYWFVHCDISLINENSVIKNLNNTLTGF